MKITDIDKVKHMQVHFEVAEQVKSDSRFTPVKIWIAHTGKNLNKSYFSKELLESMIPSLKFIPIVGFIQTDNGNKDDFAGHEERYIVTKDGVEVEYLGRMYGFIPEDNNARFEMKTVGGVEREYLVADGIIVNKFAKAKEILDRDSEKGQSMELVRETLDGYYEKKDDQFVITSAEFDALCILGDSKIPAMVGGAIEKIQFTAMKFELQELINELKLELKNEKGGNGLDITKFEELMSQFTHIKSEFAEDIKSKLDTFETEESLIDVLKQENDSQFALTIQAQLGFLRKKVSDLEVYRDDWGYVESRYYFRDANFETMEVYATDYKDWKDVGFTFVAEGDGFKINEDSKFNVAWQPVKLGEGTSSSFEVATELKSVYDLIAVKVDESKEIVKSEYETQIETLKTEYETKTSELETEVTQLREYKQSIETQVKVDYVNAVENLTESEKEDLVAGAGSYSLEQLTDEVAKVIGKKSIKFSTKEVVVADTLVIRPSEPDRKRRSYEALFEEKN